MSSLLLRGGRVIDLASRTDGQFDVLVVDGKIDAVKPAGAITSPEACPVVNVRNCWVVPGLIDVHVHLRDPGFPQKETIQTGLRAAAAGGFTTVAAMANTKPVNDSPATTEYMIERAQQAHTCRLAPVSAVTRGLLGREKVDYAAMARAGARLFSDDGMPVDDERLLADAMRGVAELGRVISLHEEDRGLSCDGAVNAGPVAKELGVKGYPNAAESKRIRRDLALAIETGAPIHIAHISTRESLDLIREARARGAKVTCEVTPHHFALDHRAALRWGPNAKMNPPLRGPDDVEAIRDALSDGTIDMIASDHAPHDPSSKHLEEMAGYFSPEYDAGRLSRETAELFASCANGIVGLETSLGLAMDLVHRSLIGPSRLVELMSLKPGRLLRFDAGNLAPGATADMTVIDPNLDWIVRPDHFRSKSRNTPFAGMRLQGKAVLTIVEGQIVYDGRAGNE